MFGCAAKKSLVSEPVPSWDFVEIKTLSPSSDLSENDRRAFKEGWGALVIGNLSKSSEILRSLSRRNPGEAEINTALGFLELRLGNRLQAENYFHKALRQMPELVAAQSGYFLNALANGDDGAALERLDVLRQYNPGSELVGRYWMTMSLELVELRLREARQFVATAQYAEALQAYSGALKAAPETGGLYLETAEAALKAGEANIAISYAQRATELEPTNASSYVVLGEAHIAVERLEAAIASYREALRLRPEDEMVRGRLQELQIEYERVYLPVEYARISKVEQLTREQLAALLAVELSALFQHKPVLGSVIATDINDSWARGFILQLLSTDILEVLPNHTFQPKALVRRVDLATALSAALASIDPMGFDSVRQRARVKTIFSDLLRENIYYDAAAIVVRLGLITPGDKGKFEPQRFVSGQEGTSAVEALAAYISFGGEDRND